MRFARALLIFGFGLFTIAAQTLLFREFITTFEGNDISVGIFFGSWFLWVGLAATLVYKLRALAEMLLRNIELLFLIYLPAFVIQLILIVQARELAGIEPYALWSVRSIFVLSIVVNAPVSIITGLLFPTACRWVRSDRGAGVSRVYLIEAAGSFAGGLGVTVLLGLGAGPARIFFILALVVSSAVFAVRLASLLAQPGRIRQVTCALSCLLPIALCICLVAGVDRGLMRRLRVTKWTKLLDESAFAGSFQTPQAEYLYGTYQGQWIAVREGSVCEAVPDATTAGRIAAISLCQNPKAESVLVVGSGLGLCTQLLELPQLKSVTWMHGDPEYTQVIDDFLPPELIVTDTRFDRPAGDVRSILGQKEQAYDIVILNLPEATSSVLNRYYTLEFYSQVKKSLRPDGVLAVRVAAGENIMGTELINLGASVKLTLEKVFSQFVLTPGEESWFIVSDSNDLTPDPATLRDRFASIDGADNVFSPEALLSVYLPDRAAAALERYSRADLPRRLLINTDSKPLTYLYSLLLAAKQSGAPLTRFVKHLAMAGPLIFLAPLLVFVILRLVYILRTAPGAVKSAFDSSFLVFSTGSVGIGTIIVLMYLYQTYFGSLYLHIGIISSLFMVGVTAAAALIGRLLRPTTGTENAKESRPQMLLLAVIAVHALIIAAIAFLPGERWGPTPGAAWQPAHLMFAAAFVICGMCAGCYFPIAARRLADSGFDAGQTGSKLETADHLGAAAGGVITSLALVPVLGAKVTLLIFALLILANTPAAVLKILKPQRLTRPDTDAATLRRLGYALFGLGLTVVLCSNLLAEAGARLSPLLPRHTARAMAGEQALAPASAALAENAAKIDYFEVYQTKPSDPNAVEPLDAPKLAGYIFSSQSLAPEVRGFGGKMNLGVHIDTAGRLVDFHIIRSNETPSYLDMLAQWRQTLIARALLEPEPFAEIDTVTGATVSSQAIMAALQTSTRRFAADVLGLSLDATAEDGTYRADSIGDAHGAYLIGAFAIAILITYLGEFWTRIAALLLAFVLGGIILNTQYSIEQIATLLSLHTPAVKLSGAFLLVIGIPLLVAVFGNVYCGYLCPFGAAQEMLSYILPAKYKPRLALETMRKARFLKYVILLVLLIAFFLSRNRTTLAADPLISFFTLQFSFSEMRWSIFDAQLSMLLILIVIAAASLFYTRFWCRYLCGVGAFLSLFNRIAILKRILPAKEFGRCEFGLSPADQLDCICCDRCRYEPGPPARPPSLLRTEDARLAPISRCLLIGVLAAAIFISAVSLDRFARVIPTSDAYTTEFSASGGQSRNIDIQRFQKLIQQKKLSDHEAEFYKRLD